MTGPSRDTTHRISWFARLEPCAEAPDGWLPRQASMRGSWGWDVKCSCGQQSRTGGGVQSWVKRLVYFHTHYGWPLDGPGSAV
jgi:hypothetical protein